MEKQSYELINGVAQVAQGAHADIRQPSSRVRFILTVPMKVKRILRKNPNISIIHLNDGLMGFCGSFIKRITVRSGPDDPSRS